MTLHEKSLANHIYIALYKAFLAAPDFSPLELWYGEGMHTLRALYPDCLTTQHCEELQNHVLGVPVRWTPCV